MPRFLAIDYGRKRIGLAISDSEGRIASPLVTRPNSAPPVQAAADVWKWVVREYEVDAWVVGLPLSMDDSEGPQAKETRAFADSLAKASGKPVHFWDERLSSWAADQAMSDAGLTRQKRKDRVDRVAAQMILQGFLDHRERPNDGSTEGW